MFVMFYVFSLIRNENDIYLSFGYREKSAFIGIEIFLQLYRPVNSPI